MRFLLLIITFITLNVNAQENLDVNIQSDTRYDNIKNEQTDENIQNRYQERIRIGFTYDHNGKFQIVGLLSTGNHFGNDWATVHDLNTGNKQPVKLAFRRLYIQMIRNKTTVQLGGLDSFKLYGSGGVGNSGGWIDGLRVKQKTNYGNLNIVMGSVSDPSNTDVFTRSKELNFIEVGFSRELLEGLILESEYQYYNDEANGAAELKYSPEILGKKVLTLVADALYNFEHKATNYDLGLKWDILKTFRDNWDDRLNLTIYRNHLDSKINDRNNLYGLYFADGTYTTGGLNGKINKNGNFR